MKTLLSSLSIFLCLFGLLFHGACQANHCDPMLERDDQNPLSYRLRGERCEGLYIEQVASTALVVASLTASFQDFDIAHSEALQIIWPTVGDAPTRLRAKGVKWKLYYRMDAVRPAGVSSFSWPTVMLDALDISKQDIGVVGWTTLRLGETEHSVYLPLNISPSRGARRANRYRLVIVPGVQLSEVFVSLATLDKAGNTQTFLQDGEPLKYGFYPPHRPIDINLTHISDPGLYYVEIGATLQSGGSTTLAFLLYHAPEDG
jgi:hypothetical protein